MCVNVRCLPDRKVHLQPQTLGESALKPLAPQFPPQESGGDDGTHLAGFVRTKNKRRPAVVIPGAKPAQVC